MAPRTPPVRMPRGAFNAHVRIRAVIRVIRASAVVRPGCHQLLLGAWLIAAAVQSSDGQRKLPGAELRGIVIDTLGNCLGNAVVSVLGISRAATTDTGGAFSIAGLPAGSYDVLTRKSGFDQRLVDVSVPDSGSVDLLISLTTQQRSASLLDTVVTRATAPSRAAIAEAEARRALGVGYYIPSETIAKHRDWAMTSLLRATTSGITYVRHCSRGYSAAGTQDGSLSLRPVREPGCVMPAGCYMQIFLDGIRLYSYDGNAVPPSLDDLRLQEVEAVEVYRGAETPVQYRSTGSMCGTILIWLRH